MEGQLFGHYRVTRKLGAGGMAEVYAVKHESLGREAAVKVISPHLLSSDDMTKRFFQEAQAAASIRHPGIVDVFDLGTTPDGRAYLLMELLHGQTLDDRLKERGQLSVEEARTIMRQIAMAVGAAHDQGIIHRDLKPGNVFLTRDPENPTGERVKVLDFGLAKLAEGSAAILTGVGTLLGTPSYMAPEQCRDSSNVDHRADLYALGCIFYKCVCGIPPFGVHHLQAFNGHLNDAPVPPIRRNPRVPADLNALILRLLEKTPDRRYATCAELVRALDGNSRQLVRSPAPTTRPVTDSKHLLSEAAVPMLQVHSDHEPKRFNTVAPEAAEALLTRTPTALCNWSASQGSHSGAEQSPLGPTGMRESSPSMQVRGEVSQPSPRAARRRQRLAWGTAAAGMIAAMIAMLVMVQRRESRAVTKELIIGEIPPVTEPSTTMIDASAPPDILPDILIDDFEQHMKRAGEAIGQEQWDAAASVLEEALRAGDLDETQQERARKLHEIAVMEAAAKRALEELRHAIESGDLDQARTIYGGIPENSRYRQAAKEIYEPARRVPAEQAPTLAEGPGQAVIPTLTEEPGQAVTAADEATRIFNEARTAYIKDEFQKAYNKCREAYRLDKQSNDVKVLCGMAACRLKKPDVAKQYYTKLDATYREAIMRICEQEGTAL